MGLGEVPFWTQARIDEVEVHTHLIEVAVTVWESEVFVVETIRGELTTDVLHLVPEVGDDETPPFSTTKQSTIDGSDDFDLP